MQYIRAFRRPDTAPGIQTTATGPVRPDFQMTYSQIAGAAVLCAFLSVAPAAAPDASPGLQRSESLTLSALVDDVLARYPDAESLPARIEEAARFDALARSLLADTPAVEMRYQTGRIGNNDNLREFEAGIALPLWRFGERRASRDVARDMQREADRFGERLRWQVAGVLRSALWRIELTANRVARTENAAQVSADLLRSIERQVGLGILPRSDLLQARQDLLRSESRVVEARVEHANAVRAYRIIAGQDQRPAVLAETRSARTGVVEDHPALAYSAAQLARATAEYRLERQSGSSSPSLLLGARSERGGNDPSYEDSVGVFFSYPLGFGAHAKAAVAAAGTREAEARAEHRAQRQALELEVHDAAESLAGAEHAFHLAREMNDMAQQHLAMSKTAFELGEINLMTFLIIKENAYDAQVGASEKEIEWRRAIAFFNQAVGELP